VDFKCVKIVENNGKGFKVENGPIDLERSVFRSLNIKIDKKEILAIRGQLHQNLRAAFAPVGLCQSYWRMAYGVQRRNWA
jgi:hypothetical protein